ncbi:guanylyl and adenylyl cyclase family member, partial [Volvox carteri f. nagariensis]
VAHALRAGEAVQPERFECVSIFFSDVVGYTTLCEQLQPYEVMDLMHRLYSKFDDLIRQLRLFKVETVGDAYLAVGNLRWPQPDSHSRLVSQFAFAAVRAAKSLPVHPARPELGTLRIRVGLHCGPVVGSVVGTLNRRYCLFGDAVNTAARMEANSEADRVHCSTAFAALVSEQWPELTQISRGVRQIKGKG